MVHVCGVGMGYESVGGEFWIYFAQYLQTLHAFGLCFNIYFTIS